MEDNNTFGGAAQGWTGKIPNPPKVVSPGAGSIGHAKAVAAAKWLEDNHKYSSYMVFAHIERKGAWNPDLGGGNNNGFNVEHFRDFNNAAPHAAFGFEAPARPPGRILTGGLWLGRFPGWQRNLFR